MAGPDFLILGCQKGGTTSLYDLVAAHPRIQPARTKEVHFFSLHYARGSDWYADQLQKPRRSLSRALSGRRLYGEATPYYLFHPLAAERIRRDCPRARLIVLLRDPVERALSHYFHSRRLGFEPLPLPEALDAEPSRLEGAEEALARGERHFSHQEHSYVGRSRYDEQLERYGRWCRPEQLLVLRSESFFANPQAVTQRVWRFLKLKPPTGLQQGFPPAGAPSPIANQGLGEASGVSPAIRQRLEAELQQERTTMELWLESSRRKDG